MSTDDKDLQQQEQHLITRREAVQRVTALLGGIALVGGSSLFAACDRERATNGRDTAAAGGKIGEFSPEDVAFLDEVADTILPTTAKSPGAKAAKTGAFMALMVTDTYEKGHQKAFRDGLKTIDDASKKAHNDVGFMQATPAQRLALLQGLDREAKADTDAKSKQGSEADKQKAAEQADKRLSDQRQENAKQSEVGAGGATAIPETPAPHYFRMMKELAMLGYFTSEIGYTKAMRYVETPGRYDPCATYAPGETAWAPHA
jgi:hypothetical protein